MASNLAKLRRKREYAAIVAVAADRTPYVRLSSAVNIESLLPELQRGNWNELFFRQVFWVPGLPVAQTICRAVEKFLIDTSHHIRDHWFEADEGLILQLVQAESASMRSPIWSHETLVKRLRHEQRAEAQRFADGIW